MATTTTTNYGWTIPQDSELVKDGAAAIRTLGNAADASLKTVSDAAIAKTIVDAKGDLIAATAADTVSKVSVGTDGQVLTADSTQSTGVKWATPTSSAVTWTPRKLPNANQINAIAYDGSSLYVAGDSGGGLFTSPDGITWTSRTSAFGAQPINHIAYGAGTWVAVGGNGLISSSTDGITWTARTAGVSTNALNHVAYLNSLWVAVGAGANGGTGGITTSSNGTTWTKQTTPTSSGTECFFVTYGNGYYVIGTNSGTSKNLLYSSNGTTWTAGVTNTTAAGVLWVYWNGTQWIVGHSGSNSGSYTANTPPATFTGLGEQIVSTNSAMVKSTTIYNGYAYTPQDSTPYTIGVFKTSITSNRLDAYKAPILVPNNGLIANGATPAMLVTSAGNILIGDAVGRIYTSF